MLVDIAWTKDYVHYREKPGYLKDFITNDGSLTTVHEYPPDDKGLPRIFRRKVAVRVHKGVYWARDLWNDLELYSTVSVEHPWTESQKIWDDITVLPREELRDQLRQKFLRLKSNYGLADNLKQVFHYGRSFLRSENPYALAIKVVDVSGPDGDRYFEKNGEYIGILRGHQIQTVIHFDFHKLIEKRLK